MLCTRRGECGFRTIKTEDRHLVYCRVKLRNIGTAGSAALSLETAAVFGGRSVIYARKNPAEVASITISSVTQGSDHGCALFQGAARLFYSALPDEFARRHAGALSKSTDEVKPA